MTSASSICEGVALVGYAACLLFFCVGMVGRCVCARATASHSAGHRIGSYRYTHALIYYCRLVKTFRQKLSTPERKKKTVPHNDHNFRPGCAGNTNNNDERFFKHTNNNDERFFTVLAMTASPHIQTTMNKDT